MMALKKPQSKLDPEEFFALFKEAVKSGLADTMLSDFYDVIDDRIRWYMGTNGSPLDADFYEALQVQRKLKTPVVEPVIYEYYGLLGSKYQGVEVELVTILNDGKECRVTVRKDPTGNLSVGDTYRVPVGALTLLEVG
jgi:hypothetical protein